MSKKLVEALSSKTSVPVEQTEKILNALGLETALKEVGTAAGEARVNTLTVGDMKLAFRLGRSSVAV